MLIKDDTSNRLHSFWDFLNNKPDNEPYIDVGIFQDVQDLTTHTIDDQYS